MAKKRSRRARTRVEQNTFVRGLITEASPLTFPENASLEEENFILHTDGSRQRRLGVLPELNNGDTVVSFNEDTTTDIEHFLWKNAGSKQTIDISVLKIGDKFYFFDNNAENVSASPLNAGNPITILGFDPSGAGAAAIYDYAFINGKMFVVTGFPVVTVLTFDVATSLISQETKNVSIRDSFGIHEDIAVDFRPELFTSEITSAHIYNLVNQGWLDHLTLTDGTTVFEDFDSIAATAREGITFPLGIGHYPSNADQIGLNKVSSTAVPAALGLYNPDELTKATYGTRNAPKGHVIFDSMFIRGSHRNEAVKDRSGRHTAGSIGTVTDPAVEDAELTAEQTGESTAGGFNHLASYAGRIVYTVYENGTGFPDDNTPSYGDMIFFSQATDGISGLTKCYTELDPTDPDTFAALDTDGGHITLSGIGTINALEVLGNSLFVFADNGVWQVSGGGSIFTSTNVNVNKITTIGNIGRKSVVIAEDKLYYMTNAGVYVITLATDIDSRISTAVPLTQATIQSFFDAIPTSQLENIIGYYDVFARQIKWLVARGSLPNRNYFDTEIVYDLNLQSFYINAYRTVATLAGTPTPYILGFLERPTRINVPTEDIVVVAGDPVEVLTDPVVITFRDTFNNLPTSNKYWSGVMLTPTELTITVVEYRDLLFRDWANFQNDVGGFGEDANAFLLTGYLTGGDSASNKRITYITSHFRRTEREFIAAVDGFNPDNPSSCTLTGQWEWTNSVNAGRWSNPQQVYKLPRTFIPDSTVFDYGHEVVTTKTKLRGKGKALSLLFETAPLHDCHLYGWSYEINSEASV